MKLTEFDYHLPPELIAQHPARKRSASRMLVLDRGKQTFSDRVFGDLPEILDASSFLVVNDSKVFKARLFGRRQSGGKVEIFLVRRQSGDTWLALLRPSGRVRAGEKIYFGEQRYLTAVDEPGPVERQIAFASPEEEAAVISEFGRVPLPPYIRREAGEDDLMRYQTVYARHTGSVAAPTAGLHFDDEVMARLEQKGIARHHLTLHVGPGTFKPVTVDDIESHIIDPEYATISAETAAAINREKTAGKRLVAVGTTSIRTLEAGADADGKLRPISELVNLYIYPPYRYRIVDAMVTNFHLPKSSLLMLVAAFCGREFLFEAYRHAIAEKYRFYSYGDCMLII